MSNLTVFQTILLFVFGFITLIAVLIFAGILPGFRSPAGGVGGTVLWWGTVPQDLIKDLLRDFNDVHKADFTLQYEAKDPRTLERELLEALASGHGPDLVSFPDNLILKQGDKLWPIPFETLSRRAFQDAFVRQGELFLASDGILGLPFYLDPLVLYYNIDLLSSNGFAAPPKLWSEVQTQVGKLTRKDATGNIVQSAVAIGKFSNILHAKEILTLLLLQAGNPIVSTLDSTPKVVLKESFGFSRQPASEALEFFNRFVDPTNSLYSWNNAMPEAREMFVRGDLALYLGFAGEYDRLRRQNPNLNFDVALVPQRGRTPSLTHGRLTAISILNSSRNKSTAFQVAYLLTGADFASRLSALTGLPPTRVDLLNRGSRDPYRDVFYQSAIISRGWLDPEPNQTLAIFRKMTEESQSGRLTSGKAVDQAQAEMELLWR